MLRSVAPGKRDKSGLKQTEVGMKLRLLILKSRVAGKNHNKYFKDLLLFGIRSFIFMWRHWSAHMTFLLKT